LIHVRSSSGESAPSTQRLNNNSAADQRGRRNTKKKLGEELKKERAEPGEDEKDWGLTKGKLKQRRGSDVGGTTLPHRRLRLRAAGTDKEGEEREKSGKRGLTDKEPGGRRHRPAKVNQSSPSSLS
jgi:hypothetical protein